jgi:tetratricopeptide (TPR) repeat protein
LDERLRDVCLKTGTEAKTLLLPRAIAEFGSGRYDAAAKSLETCLQQKLWSEWASEVMLTGALARSHRALGRRHDAIKWYRRAVEISGIDPSLLAEFLCLVVDEEGVNGLLRELSSYEHVLPRLDVRRNATLYCFSAWALLAKGDNQAAVDRLVQGDTYLLLASQQPVVAENEGFVCVAILQIVAEKLADSRRLARATDFLKRFPPERVKAMREVFLLPKRK